MRDAAVQLCLLHEDLGPAPDGPGLRRGELRQAAVRRAPRAVPRGRRAADQDRGPAEPDHRPALRRGGDRSRSGCSGYNVAGHASRSRPRRCWCWSSSLAGLAYPIAEWLRLRQAIRQANRSAGGDLRVPRAEARAPPERRRPLPRRRSRTGSRFENVTLESRSGRVLLDGVSVEIPGRARGPRSWAWTRTRSTPWSA